MILFKEYMYGCNLRRIPCLLRSNFRGRNKIMFWQHTTKMFVHTIDWITNGHGGEGIAVISAPNGGKPLFARVTATGLILQRNLNGHFHGYGTRVCQKYRF